MRYVYLGINHDGLLHIPCDASAGLDYAACRPFFGLDQPIEIFTKVFSRHEHVTCLECAIRFETLYVQKGSLNEAHADRHAQEKAQAQAHQLEGSCAGTR